MPIEAGSVEVRIGATTEGLVAATRSAAAAINRFGQDAQASLDAAFAGHNLSPALRQAVGSAITDARRTMESRMSGAQDALARGLIDQKGFAKRARDAGQSAVKELQGSFKKMAQVGILPPDVAQRLTADLTDAARRAGEDAGRAMVEGVARSASASSAQMQAIGRKMTLGITAPITAAAAASAAMAIRAGRAADEILALEQATGLSVTALQEYRRVATVAGVSADQIADAAGRLQRRLRGVGEETAEVQAVMRVLGVGARTANGELRSMDSLLPELVRSLQGIGDITLRNALATRLFGRGTEALAPVLGMSADAFERARREAHELGLVLSSSDLQAASQFRVQWDSLRQSLGAAGRDIGVELLPAMSSLVRGMREHGVPAARGMAELLGRLRPETVRLGIGFAAAAAVMGPATTATLGVVRALAALRAANMALLTTLGPAGAVVAGLAVLSGWFVKNRLDALAAAGAVDEYRTRLGSLGTVALQREQGALAEQMRGIRGEIARYESALSSAEAAGSTALANNFRRRLENARERLAEVGDAGREVSARLRALQPAAATAGNAIEEGLTKPTRETASALSRLTEQVVRFQSLRSLGIPDFDAAPRDLQQAADAAIRLQSELSRARTDLAILGGAAPAGTQDYLASLEQRAQAAEVATRALARTWETGLQRMQQVRPEIAQSILPDLPSPATAAAQYEQRMREIREQMARGLMQPREFEEAGRAAGEAYKAALLETLDQLRAARAISPEIEADIIAKLTPLLNLDPATREFGSAATEVGRGLLNVADSFGAVDEKTRRAATGLNEIAAAAGQIKGGGLLQAGNIGALMGLAGGIAQTLSGALGGLFGRGREDQQRTQELAQAVRDLRAAVQGMRGTGEALAGAVRAAGEFRATPIDLRAIYQLPQSAWGKAIDEANAKALNEALLRTGITLEQLEAAAQAAGLSIYDQAGKIDYQKLRTAEFAEALALATQQLVGFRSTLSDQRQRQSIEDKLFGRPTDAAARLANQMELLEKFMPEFAAGLRGIDTSTAEGRARLQAQIQEMWRLFVDGALDLEKLTREEWLDLIQGFADAFDSFRDAADRAAGALLNVPALFDLALRRRQSAMEFPGLPMGASPVVPGGGYTGGTQRRPAGDVHVHIHNPPAGMDVEATRRQVKSTLRDDPEARVLVRRAAGRY